MVEEEAEERDGEEFLGIMGTRPCGTGQRAVEDADQCWKMWGVERRAERGN